MDEQLKNFVDDARNKGMDNRELTELLAEKGWSRAEIAMALYGDLAIPVPAHRVEPSYNSAPALNNRPSNDPIAVVQNLSTRGFEYSIMFVALWASAFSLGLMLHEFINNAFYTQPVSRYGYDYYRYDTGSNYAFPLTVMLVTLPIFVFMFLRLKRAELTDEALRRDPSRKRLSHLTQFVSFATGLGYVIFFLYSLISGEVGKRGAQSFGELFMHMLITLAIAGGIFAYYWVDEHRANRTL